MSIYDYKVLDRKGNEISIADFKGKIRGFHRHRQGLDAQIGRKENPKFQAPFDGISAKVPQVLYIVG